MTPIARITEAINFYRVTYKEIVKIVSKMKNKQSCGYDDIPITLIKSTIDIFAVPLAKFYNNCIASNLFPEQLKIAKVVPVHKKGCNMDPNNYRPISLLPVLSKIFEKIIKIRLNKHLNRNRILNHRQFGYRQSIGTRNAINTLIDDATMKLMISIRLQDFLLI